MKPKVIVIMLSFFFVTSFQVEAKAQSMRGRLIFEGTVLQIGPPVFHSGRVTAYRLVKYKVERVCKGNYDQREIVIDHLILTGKELNDLEIGDKVFVTAKRSKKISPRYNAPGIREASESISNFFIGSVVNTLEPPVCSGR